MPMPRACACYTVFAQVRCHPWFTAHLPRYLAVMQADTAVNIPRLDEEMINEVSRTLKGYAVCCFYLLLSVPTNLDCTTSAHSSCHQRPAELALHLGSHGADIVRWSAALNQGCNCRAVDVAQQHPASSLTCACAAVALTGCASRL